MSELTEIDNDMLIEIMDLKIEIVDLNNWILGAEHRHYCEIRSAGFWKSQSKRVCTCKLDELIKKSSENIENSFKKTSDWIEEHSKILEMPDKKESTENEIKDLKKALYTAKDFIPKDAAYKHFKIHVEELLENITNTPELDPDKVRDQLLQGTKDVTTYKFKWNEHEVTCFVTGSVLIIQSKYQLTKTEHNTYPPLLTKIMHMANLVIVNVGMEKSIIIKNRWGCQENL